MSKGWMSFGTWIEKCAPKLKEHLSKQGWGAYDQWEEECASRRLEVEDELRYFIKCILSEENTSDHNISEWLGEIYRGIQRCKIPEERIQLIISEERTIAKRQEEDDTSHFFVNVYADKDEEEDVYFANVVNFHPTDLTLGETTLDWEKTKEIALREQLHEATRRVRRLRKAIRDLRQRTPEEKAEAERLRLKHNLAV